LAAFGASQANADIGDLGPPAAEAEVKQSLVDFNSAGKPPAASLVCPLWLP
jgi:hypothetical protein